MLPPLWLPSAPHPSFLRRGPWATGLWCRGVRVWAQIKESAAGAATSRATKGILRTKHPLPHLMWALTLVGNFSVFLEMLAMRNGPSAKWKAIVWVESAKAALRLWMLHRTGWKTMVNGGQHVALLADGTPSTPPEVVWWKGRRSGTLMRLPPGQDGRLARAMIAARGEIVPAPSAPFGRWHVAAEMTQVLRPVLYTVLRLAEGWGQIREPRASWASWLLSFGLSLLSARFSAMACQTAKLRCAMMGVFGEAAEVPPHIAQELSRRKYAMLVYLLWSPLWEGFTKKIVDRIQWFFSYIPLLGMLVNFFIYQALYFRRFYFWCSQS